MNVKDLRGVLLGFAVLVGAGSALADEAFEKALFLDVVIPVEVQFDGNFKTDTPGGSNIDLFTTTEPEVTVGLLPGLTLFIHGVLEPMRDAKPGENRFFRSHGLLLEDLYLQYKATLVKDGPHMLGVRVWGGKFTPNFGFAWDAAPGIYGTDFVEDYEKTERIGFGGALSLQHAALGTHTLSASTFILDRTVFSGSVITKRTRTRLADGGPSNTRGLKSFHVALEGEKIPGLEGLTYHASFIRQYDRSGRYETGFAIGLGHAFEAGAFTISPLIEFVRMHNAEGVSGQNHNFLTTSVKVERKGWHAALSHTLRHANMPGAGTTRDNLVQVSGGYSFENGLGIEVGWSHRNEDSIGTHTIGVLFTYELSFQAGKR